MEDGATHLFLLVAVGMVRDCCRLFLTNTFVASPFLKTQSDPCRLFFSPFIQFSAQVNAFMCPPLFTWLVGKSELTEGVVDLKVSRSPEGFVGAVV